MEDFVQQLKEQVPFKETTGNGDIVLLASDEPRMVVYATVVSITPDPGRKLWWNVTMHVLSVPPKEVVWTLREEQFCGKEVFTFSGIPHFMKAVDLSPAPEPPAKDSSSNPREKGQGHLRVVK